MGRFNRSGNSARAKRLPFGTEASGAKVTISASPAISAGPCTLNFSFLCKF